MSNDRPKGSYSGPLSLQWCAYSMTVRAMPMNYLAADLSRIDAALWGRESEIAAAIAELPAMVEALRAILPHAQEEADALCDVQSGEDEEAFADTVQAKCNRAAAILSRIDGAGDSPNQDETACASCGAPEGESHKARCEARGFAIGAQARREHTLPDAPAPTPTGDAWAALDAARGYASNPEQWNPPSPEQMAEILAMIDRKGEN